MGLGDADYAVSLNNLPQTNIAKTPNIDAMANGPNTWILNNMHSESACSPTRISILTARSPLRDCVVGEPMSASKTIYYEQAQTVVQLARDQGYDTLFLGKFLGNVERQAQFPSQLGFQDWRAMQGGTTYNYTCGCRDFRTTQGVSENCYMGHDQYTSTSLLHAMDCVSRIGPLGTIDYPAGVEMDTDFLVSEFKRWRVEKESSGRPYFAQISFKSVHIPFVASPELRERCASLEICRKPNASSRELDYGGCIASVDQAVGTIRTFVKNDAGRDTIIIFVSDNGPAPLTGTFAGAGSTGGLRGAKTTLYEGLLRVPALLEWPNKIPRPQISNALLSIMDLPATMAHVITGNDSFGQDGRSILSNILRNEPTFDRENNLGVCSFVDDTGQKKKLVCDHMVYFHPSGRFKLVARRLNAANSKGNPNTLDAKDTELYDLWSEEGEYSVYSNPEVKLDLATKANAWLTDLFSSFRSRCEGYY